MIAALVLLAQAALAAPAQRGTIDVAGVRREYLLVRPGTKTDGKRPLVFVLHGHHGSASQALGGVRLGRTGLARWNGIADREGVLVVAPDGARGSDNARGWNDCRTDAPTGPRTDDVAFLNALAARMIADENADPRRVYVTGMSNGAIMSFRAALEMTPRPAAIAAVCGAMAAKSACGPPSAPVSALLIVGTRDPLVPYAGGNVGFWGRPGRGSVLSAAESAAYWRKADGLAEEAATESIPHLDSSDPTRATRASWGTPAGPQVVLIAIEGGGHVEPSVSIKASWLYRLFAGRENRDLEVADEAWAFFKDKRAAAAR